MSYDKFIGKFTRQLQEEFECEPELIINIINSLEKCDLKNMLDKSQTEKKPTTHTKNNDKLPPSKQRKKLNGYTYYLKFRKIECSFSDSAKEWQEFTDEERKYYKNLALEQNILNGF